VLPRRSLASALLVVGIAVAALAVARTRPPAPGGAADPSGRIEPDAVPALDDAKLYALYQQLFPGADEDIGLRAGGDPDEALKYAAYVQIRERGIRRLSEYLSGETQPDLEVLDDPTLFLLLYSVIVKVDRGGGSTAESRQRFEAVARHVVRRGGRLRDVALAKYPFTDVAWMGDGDLRDLLPRLRGMSGGWEEGGRTRERILCEIVRRAERDDADVWEQILSGELRQLRRAEEDAEDLSERLDVTPSLETLTAFRRVQGKPDPVRVEVAGPVRIETVFSSLPRLDVSLVNADAGKETVAFQEGGDYRSGRQARWRIEMRDEAGTLLPVRDRLSSTGGGFFRPGRLGPGDEWSTSLNTASWIVAPPPGKYTVRVLYHDSVTIADEPGVDGLIVSSSGPLELTIKPLVFAEDEVDRRKVSELLAAIDDAKGLKVVAGTYGKWAHGLVPPDSPQGRLLAAGLPALPPLLDALDAPDLAPTRRAVILSLLFSLTGQNDPRETPGVLGGYETTDGAWAISNDGATSFGWGGGGVFDRGDIDVAVQRDFAERWAPWKRHVRVGQRRI
jgi:hypothetical protein